MKLPCYSEYDNKISRYVSVTLYSHPFGHLIEFELNQNFCKKF